VEIPHYPVSDIIPELKEQLAKRSVVILQAPPGAGKSTILPLALMDETWLNGKKILMLEPRRLAARSVATRMAELCDEEPGERIGYRVRFENRVSKRTQVEVVTEGILTRMMQQDNELKDCGLVIFDEFHERSLNADLGLALCNQIRQVLRDDLRILVMSATIDTANLSALLDGAPVITSEGRQFPVDIRYIERDEKEYIQNSMARVIRQALNETKGDILAFLPGAGEIQRTQESLENSSVSAAILPLYGELSHAKQSEALTPMSNGRRKIVLATSIAETSLTIEGIGTVVDCGLARVPRFDPNSGLTRLETVKVTRDAADQRAGRAGRLGPGVCYRLWSQHSHQQLNAARKPEILEADLAPLMLDLAQWGINDIKELAWITLPPAGTVAQAKELLEQLGATKDGKITSRGREMQQLPTHPRIAHLLLDAKKWSAEEKYDYLSLAADVAAIIEERDPLGRESGTDLSLRVELLRKWRAGERVNVDRRALDRIERLAASWRRELKCKANNEAPDHYSTGRLIAAAYPERVAGRTEKGSLRYRLANGRFAKIAETDPLHTEEFLAIAQLDGSSEGRVYLACALSRDHLREHMQERVRVRWDEERGMVSASAERTVGSIVLDTRPVTKISEDQRIEIICEQVRQRGLRWFGWSESQDELRARMMSVRAWHPDQPWPDVSEKHLQETPEEWLAPYLGSVSKLSELQKLNLNQILISMIPWELSARFEQYAPAKMEVPTGSMIQLKYSDDGSRVEMAVRLQEMFGVLETPAVDEGRKKILLQLLSPGYKPVQITQDLRSFWQKTYFEVRKDLLSRYPKHHWPDDPLKAEPVRGPKRRK
jgi:ATP-dependent helicase HrpB